MQTQVGAPLKILYITQGGGSQTRGLPNGSARIAVDLATSHSSNFLPMIVFLGQESGGSIQAKQILQTAGIKYLDIEWHGSNNVPAIIASQLHLYHIIRSEKPDVVCLNAVPATYLGWLPAKLAGARLIFAIVHLIPSDRKEGLLAETLRFSQHIVFVSLSSSNYYLQQGLVNRSNYSVIQNGIQLERFANLQGRQFRQAPYVISMAGRLHPPHKDPITLLKAFSIVRQKNYPVRLRFIGDGHARNQIENFCSAQGLQDSVEITGFTERVDDYLRDTDISVLSTWWEGLPLVVIEAMAAGLPVIASKVIGVTDIIQDHQTGFLVPPGDPASLANAIISILENSAEALRIGRNARQYALEHFDCYRMAKQYEEKIQSLLK